jgi:tripeptide aminopeptidase
VMLDAARRIVTGGLPHAGVELLFTSKEEVGLLGAYAFDHTRLEARLGYVYDQAAPIGEIILGAPTQKGIFARFHGRASHAGMYPEEGRSAVLAAARAVGDMRLGRIDHQSSANVGVITGGTARNIVPEWCSIQAEARSRDPGTVAALVQEMLDAIGFAASTSDCTAETSIEDTYRGYTFTEGEPAVRLAAEGLRRAGYDVTTGFSGGGADANVFNERGLPCVNLANGMADIHTPEERIAVADLEGMVEVTLSIVEAAREP